MQQHYIVCHGSPNDIGARHGSLLKSAVECNLGDFWAACRTGGIEKRNLIREAKMLAQDYTDILVQEIRAIAKATNLDFRELLAFNLCHGRVLPDECSVMFAMGDVTASGNTLFLKNSDKIGAQSMEGPNFYKHKEINVILVGNDKVIRDDDC